MKKVYLAFHILWKQKFMNLFLIITVVSSIIYLLPIWGQIVHYSSSVKALKQLDMRNAYYLYCNPYYGRQDAGLRNSIEKLTASLSYIRGRAEFFNIGVDDSSNTQRILAYNKLLIKKFKPKIKEGRWFHNTEKEKSEKIPVVVANDIGLRCGGVFQQKITNGIQIKELTCEVIGVLENDAKIPGFTGAADDNYFTADVILNEAKGTIILPLMNELEEFLSSAGKAYQLNSRGSLLYTQEGSRQEEVFEDFGYAGIITNLDSGNQRFYKQSKFLVTAMGANFLVYLIIAIIALLSSNIIISVRMEKLYTIYYLTGMSQRDRAAIETLRTGLMIFACTAFSYLFVKRIGIDAPPFVVPGGIIGYLSLLFLPISVGFFLKQRKRNPADCVRRLHTL